MNPRSVAGIVRKGALFLVAKRLPGGSMSEKWEFPGGKVEEGEADAEALKREYQEEFAVSVRVGRLAASAQFEHAGHLIELNAYELSLSSEQLVLAEHSEYRWASLEEIAALDFADSDRKLLAQLGRSLQ